MNNPGAYRAGPIQPICDVGQNVLLVNRQSYNLYTVAYLEPLNRSFPFVFNAGAVLAGATTTIQNTQNILDMAYGELSQIRARVIDDINVVVAQPQVMARQGSQNQVATFNLFSALYDRYDHLSEFYIFENQRIFLTITNSTQYNLAQARVSFYGFRYVLWGIEGASVGGSLKPKRRFDTIQQAVESGERFTAVPVGGWGAS